MTSDNIITLPNAHLRQRSKRVGFITADIKSLASGMIKATLDWEDGREHELGVALAAVQVDQSLRLIIVRDNLEDKTDRSFQVFINPEITKYEGEKVEDMEGCLSVPDIYGKVERYNKIRLKALALDGKPVRFSAEGFLARIIQHEVDHTNGIMFIDHIKDSKEAFYRLAASGELEPLNYEKDIKSNSILW
jgi:peptide deformylase